MRREAPAYILWEDETVIAFLDAFPLSRGHALVVPKIHVSRLTELPQENYADMLSALCEICRRIERLSDHFNVGLNQGALAGQVVFHVHFHVIPRYATDIGFPVKRERLTEDAGKRLMEILGKAPRGPFPHPAKP